MLFCIGSFFLFYGGIQHLAIRSVNELWNLGHIGYFALTIYLLVKTGFLKKVALPYQWLIFLLFSLIWGVLIEVLQYDTSRAPDLNDVFRDITGCLLMLSFHPALLKLSSFALRFFIRSAVLIALGIQLIPLAVALIDETTAYLQFPVLSDFETPFELDRWDGGAAKEVVQLDSGSKQSLLKISLNTNTYSGVGMKYLPSDWSAYKSVNMRFFNPTDQSLSLVIRIHDARHLAGPLAYAHSDRFNKRINLKKGWNDISISLSVVEMAPYKRKMDMSQIRDISFFTTRLPEPAVIYLDKIYLGR